MFKDTAENPKTVENQFEYILYFNIHVSIINSRTVTDNIITECSKGIVAGNVPKYIECLR